MYGNFNERVLVGRALAPQTINAASTANGDSILNPQIYGRKLSLILIAASLASVTVLTIQIQGTTDGGTTWSQIKQWDGVTNEQFTAANTIAGSQLDPADIAGINQINSIPFVDASGSGTFTITVNGVTTGAITYSATIATLLSNINTALNATFGTSQIVASGASLAAAVLTFSGNLFSKQPIASVLATPLTGATGFTINGSGTLNVASTCAATTAGVFPTINGGTLLGTLDLARIKGGYNGYRLAVTTVTGANVTLAACFIIIDLFTFPSTQQDDLQLKNINLD